MKIKKTNEEGLKWCPFCGSNKATVVKHRFRILEGTYGVECPDCHTTSYQLYGSRNEAVTAWNTRVKDE